MPNEESPVDAMEISNQEVQGSPNVDQKNGDKGAPVVPQSLEADAEELKNLGNAEYAKKDYVKAVGYYSQAIEMCPMASYHGNRAAAYVMLGQYSKALEDARRSTLIDPSFTKGYLREAKCQLALGEVAAAVHLYEKVLERESGNAVALAEHKQAKYIQGLIAKAETSYRNGDYRTVIYKMDRCIEASPDCPKFKVLKAECLALLKRYEEAQNITSDILRSDGLNADAVYVRGLCLYYTDNYDKAFQHFQQVLRIAPDHSKAKESYKKAKTLKMKKEEGNAAYQKGRYVEAETIYKEALLIDPANVISNAKLLFNLASVYSRMKNYEEAIKQCTRAIQLDSKYIKAYLKRAQCYTDMERYEEAVKEYETLFAMERSREVKNLLERAKLELKKSKRKDYYKILNVGKNSSEEEIKKAYRKHALLHHPDRHSNATEEIKKEEERKFKEIGEAYAVLSDPKKKSMYDTGHDLEDINNGGPTGFGGGVDPNVIFQQFFAGGGGGGGGSHRGGFHHHGFHSGGFPGFTFQFG